MHTGGNIWRDRHGVCHIQGADKSEVMELMGYAHGKDRGMQILLMRILGQGRVSEILDPGDEMLNIDTFFRRMNWTGDTRSQMEKLTPETSQIADAYCQGVNRAFAEKIPWECRLFGYKPEPWRIEDSILISRMIGYLTLAQSQGEMERFLIELIQAGLEEERLNELFPGILGGLDMDLVRKVKLQERLVAPASLWNIAAPIMMASNNWAVSGKKTVSGKPILANDPHLEVNRLPNVWYEIAMTIGNTYVIGGTMPGAPAVLVGRNPDLSWSATYTFMDGTDSWVEKCKNGKYYREPDGWKDFSRRREVIKRKRKDPVTLTFYENGHGVLEGDPNEEGYYLATAWAPAFSGAQSLNSLVGIMEEKTVRRGMELLGQVGDVMEFHSGRPGRKYRLSDVRADAQTAGRGQRICPTSRMGGGKRLAGV